LSCASLSTGRLLFKLGVVGELAVWLLVLPTKWKFSGVVFDCSKLENPPGGYILKKYEMTNASTMNVLPIK
jgi:hypothetical protein